jgi:hypothetical protein
MLREHVREDVRSGSALSFHDSIVKRACIDLTGQRFDLIHVDRRRFRLYDGVQCHFQIMLSDQTIMTFSDKSSV